MATLSDLLTRSQSKCELCEGTDDLQIYELPDSVDNHDPTLLACSVCRGQLEPEATLDPNHWYCLQGAIWSEHAAVQVVAYRMLHALKAEAFAQDLIEQAYLADDVMAWAKSGIQEQETSSNVTTLDSNGAKLADGDSVTLIRDLDVKGTSFVAKRGTLVKGIRLIGDPENIEGKVNGIVLVLKTQFLKKA